MSISESKGGLSRRHFLKAMGLGGAGLLLPGSGRAETSGKTVELATLHDLSKCVGCGACVEACREANGHKFPEPEKPFPAMYPARVKVEDWSDRREVDDRLTPYNWLFLQSATVEHEGVEYEVNMPRRCMHCQNPPCANLCPWGAASRRADGVVRINDQVCLGGAKCKAVCPWKVPQRQTGVGLYLDILPSLGGNGVMFKCDRCHDRLDQGELPACISECPYEVQTIGPREEIVARAHALAEEMHGFIYGQTENGGTNTIYVSPVPFEKLNEAFATNGQANQKAGRPNLSRYGDSMADEEKLAMAALLAPFAGLAAGLITMGRGFFGKDSGKGGGDDQ